MPLSCIGGPSLTRTTEVLVVAVYILPVLNGLYNLHDLADNVQFLHAWGNTKHGRHDWHHFTKQGIQLLAFIEVPACLPEHHRKGDMTTRAVGSKMRDGRGTAKKAAD